MSSTNQCPTYTSASSAEPDLDGTEARLRTPTKERYRAVQRASVASMDAARGSTSGDAGPYLSKLATTRCCAGRPSYDDLRPARQPTSEESMFPTASWNVDRLGVGR